MTTDPIAAARALIEPLTRYGNPKARGADSPQSKLCADAATAIAALVDALEAERAENIRACTHLATVLTVRDARVAAAYEAAAQEVAEWTEETFSAVTSPDEAAEQLRALTPAHARAALGKLLAEARLEGWQPIETAPKDGSRVLLHTPDTHTDTPVLGTWNYFEEMWEEWGDYYQCNPTHWMPLPEAPQ